MAEAADTLRRQAVDLYNASKPKPPPWEPLRRVQQQLLTRLIMRALNEGDTTLEFAPSDIAEWFGISPATAREWLEKWREEEFVRAAKPGKQRIRSYVLGDSWSGMVRKALDSATDNVGGIV